MGKPLNRRKWHRLDEVTPQEYEDYHVWGEKTGQHIGIWTDSKKWVCYPHDPFDIAMITHWCCFPDAPRRNRR